MASASRKVAAEQGALKIRRDLLFVSCSGRKLQTPLQIITARSAAAAMDEMHN